MIAPAQRPAAPQSPQSHTAVMVRVMDASTAILMDMREAMNAWQENEEESNEGGIIRRTVLLDALLPPAIFLEQIGEAFSSSDLLDLARLEVLIGRSMADHGLKFDLVVTKLRRFLELLPQYQAANFGAQSSIAHERYKWATQGCRNLSALASSR